VSPFAEIGANSVLMPGVIVNSNSRVGRHCILNTACSLDHDNMLEDGVQICPGVRSAGTVSFGARSFIGTGASIIPDIKIGRDAVVGAGAVVVRDVPAGGQVAGNPARAIERGRKQTRYRRAQLP
jgi:acetyltransferase EpsM